MSLVVKKGILSKLKRYLHILIKVFFPLVLMGCHARRLPVDYSKEGYFLETYEECRDAFNTSVKSISTKNQNLQKKQISVPSHVDDHLFIDICYIPPRDKKTSLLILNSGTHGVEAYAGSAIQRLFLDELLNVDVDLSTTGVLFIHGMNPYGFKYSRRVSENNVDLNRNFYLTRDIFGTSNDLYAKLDKDHFLNPKKEYHSRKFDNLFFVLKMIGLRIHYKKVVLKEALLKGQYQDEKGIFFGGFDFEPQKKEIEQLLKELCPEYQRILLIDIHTGSGKKNKLYLHGLFNSQEAKKEIEQIFDGYEIKIEETKGIFYKTTGSFAEYVVKLASKDQTCMAVTFEFGTANTHKLLGAIKALRTTIQENQAFHYGCSLAADWHKIKHEFKQLFYPDDPVWRMSVINQAYIILRNILKKISV